MVKLRLTVNIQHNRILRPTRHIDAVDLDHIVQAAQALERCRHVNLDGVELEDADAHVRNGARVADEAELSKVFVGDEGV